MKSWLRSNPKKALLLINGIILVAGVIAFEVLLGIVGPKEEVSPSFFRYIRLREHKPHEVIIDETLPKPSELRSDDRGFIIPSFVHDDPDLTLVFLGGSTTECIICQENKRFHYQTAQLLEKASSLKINAANASFRGSNSAHSINVLFNKVLPLKPDYVVMMHNINDLVTLAFMGTYWNDHFTRSLISEVDEGLLKGVQLVLYNVLPHITAYLQRHGILDLDQAIHSSREDEWRQYRREETKVDPEEIKKAFAKNLTAFINICRSYDTVPVLMTQPNNGEDPEQVINGIRVFKMHAEMNQVILDVAKREKVRCIDLAAEIRDSDYFFDFVHFNNHGSYNVAKVIAREFLPWIQSEKKGEKKGS